MNQMNQMFASAIMPNKKPITYSVIYTDKAGNDRQTEEYTSETINMVAEDYSGFSGVYIMDTETGEIFGTDQKVPRYR